MSFKLSLVSLGFFLAALAIHVVNPEWSFAKLVAAFYGAWWFVRSLQEEDS